MTTHSTDQQLVLWVAAPSTSRHPVDVALAAVGFGIDCRDIVRRIDALAEDLP